MALKLEKLERLLELMEEHEFNDKTHHGLEEICTTCYCSWHRLHSGHWASCEYVQMMSCIREEIAALEEQDRFENFPPKVYKEEADGTDAKEES